MYQALYRKYRPSTFDDVISQPHITTALLNQLVNDKTAHAYLFTGSRGTGKTSCARILAKAINCEHSVNGNPCNECDICKDADNFALADIIEIDAASNSSVNDARELRNATAYTPERCKYKVYIIDEVHMLSKEAFNALLKIVEEPPPHVKFIMATTELHKVLPTILSRCQRFDFRRIRTEDIADRLIAVAEKEGITLENSAASLIAKTADGGMRDALSILDRCIALSNNVTEQTVSEAAGIASREQIFDLCDAIVEGDSSKALKIISDLYDSSKDMAILCQELISQFRNIMIALSAPERTDVIVCLPNELERITQIAGKTVLDDVIHYLDLLNKCDERMTRSLSKRVDLEMCVIKLCAKIMPSQETVVASSNVSSVETLEYMRIIDTLKGKIASIENMLSQDTQARRPQSHTVSAANTITDTSALKTQTTETFANWKEFLEKFAIDCPAVASTLSSSRAFYTEQALYIETTNSFFIQLLRSEDNRQKLLKSANDMLGKRFLKVYSKCVPDLPEVVKLSDKPLLDDDNHSNMSNNPVKTLLEKVSNAGIEIGIEN